MGLTIPHWVMVRNRVRVGDNSCQSHVMGWPVLSFKQNFLEICRDMHVLSAANVAHGLQFLAI